MQYSLSLSLSLPPSLSLCLSLPLPHTHSLTHFSLSLSLSRARTLSHFLTLCLFWTCSKWGARSVEPREGLRLAVEGTLEEAPEPCMLAQGTIDTAQRLWHSVKSSR
jgi:hypothetical protein